MRKLFFALLLCIPAAYAQDAEPRSVSIADFSGESRLLAVKDFTLSEGRMIVNEIPCQITSGNPFLVSVVCQANAFNLLGLEKLNEIILQANQKARATLELEQHYSLTEIRMAYNPAIKDWSLTHLFSVRDKDGHVNSKLLSMDFDSAGQFKVMKKIF